MSTRIQKEWIICNKIQKLHYDRDDCDLYNILDEISSSSSMNNLSNSLKNRTTSFYNDLNTMLSKESDSIIDSLYNFVQLI